MLFDFSRTLVPRIDALWEARKQAKYIAAVENSLEADAITLRALQRKYKPFSPRPIKEHKVFMAFVSVTFRGLTSPGKRPSRIPEASAAISSGTRPVRRPKLTSPNKSPY